ncbi:MAG: aminotransferase class IV [Porphyromonadaceae bacterium]|nr:MAG: aminotransferase class IV [Porphyromonadaceae bacterium]
MWILFNSYPMYWKNGKLIPQEFLEDPDPTLVPMVYEVFRVLKHKPLFLAEHLDRMFRSIELLGFDKPYSLKQMKNHLFELLDTEPERIGNIKIRLSWWPEPILEIGYIPHRYPTPQEQSEGVVVSTFHAIRNTPNIKLWNAALRARINQVLKDNGVFEVLLVNDDGNITEGGRTNHFYVKDSVLYTAPLESVLPGITRQKVIDAAEILNIKLIEKYLHESEVGSVDEMFTSGTSAGVQPIAVVNGIRLPKNRPITMRLQQALNLMVEQKLGPNNYGW